MQNGASGLAGPSLVRGGPNTINAAHGSTLLAGSTMDGVKDVPLVSYGMQAPLPPIRLVLTDHTYLVVRARKGSGPIVDAIEKSKKRKATSFPPRTLRIQGPAGGRQYASTLLLQLGEPGMPDEHEGRTTRAVAQQCGQWLIDAGAITEFEIYRPDMLLDAEGGKADQLSRTDTALTQDTFQSEVPTVGYNKSTHSHEGLLVK